MTLSDQAGTQATDAEQLVAYETLDDGRIARIWLNRPDAHNAQSRGLLVQLDEAFLRAEADDTVRVVILAARGKNFSAGHDLGSELAIAERQQLPSFRINGGTRDPIAEKIYLQEWHYFFQNTCRWRDLRKLNGISVNKHAKTATIGAGAQLIDVYNGLAKHGAALPGGSCPSRSRTRTVST